MNTTSSKIGAWFHPAGSEFIVWAPLRQKVELILHAPSSSTPDSSEVHSMEKDEGGYWKTTLPAAHGTKYSYRLDGDSVCPDPASFSQPEGVHGPSELVDPTDFPWTDEGWKGIPLSNMIIYELHTGSFSDTHDFEGIIQKLDYFVDLGINTLELMPLGQFPGDRNWGYDGVFPFAVQNSYGGIRGFQRLVDAAHAKGIAVLVDVVYNHFGPEGNYLEQYGPYFTDSYHTPWGKAVNFDDAWSDGVRNYFLQNARMWLEDYHVDGLRLDAVHAIKDFSALPFMRQLEEQVGEIERRTDHKKELIAELDLNDPRFIDPPEKGGYGLDGQWIDEFHHALHSLLTGEINSYYEDFGDIQHLERAFRDTYVYSGNYSVHRKRSFGSHADNNPYSQFVVFAQNHDQIGNRAIGDRLTATLSPEQLKLAAATVLLSPYVPLLFMGEEYGEKKPFPFFVSYPDPALAEVVRKGRKAEFPEFMDGEVPDPQAQETFDSAVLSLNSPHFLDLLSEATSGSEDIHSMLYRFYKYLIALRKTRPAMQGRTRDTMIVHPAKERTLCLERKILNDHLVVYLNFSDQPVSAENIQEASLGKIFDSASSEWQGPLKWVRPDEGLLPDVSVDSPEGAAPVRSSDSHEDIPPGALIGLAPFSACIFEIITK